MHLIIYFVIFWSIRYIFVSSCGWGQVALLTEADCTVHHHDLKYQWRFTSNQFNQGITLNLNPGIISSLCFFTSAKLALLLKENQTPPHYLCPIQCNFYQCSLGQFLVLMFIMNFSEESYTLYLSASLDTSFIESFSILKCNVTFGSFNTIEGGIIVKLRQGSGKDGQGMALKAKGLKA